MKDINEKIIPEDTITGTIVLKKYKDGSIEILQDDKYIGVSHNQLPDLISALQELSGKGAEGVEEFYRRYKSWVHATFDNHTTDHGLMKLQHEVKELAQDPTDITEYADVLMCLLYTFGCQYPDKPISELMSAAFNKLAINEKREWIKQPDGTWQHKGSKPKPVTPTPPHREGEFAEWVRVEEDAEKWAYEQLRKQNGLTITFVTTAEIVKMHQWKDEYIRDNYNLIRK